MRHTSCGLHFAQPAFAWQARAHHCAACLSGGGEAHELTARARRAALFAIALCTLEGNGTGGNLLSVGARPCDASAAASSLRSRLSRGTRAQATALPVSREEEKCASFPSAHAVPRWLDRPTHYEATLHRREASLLRCKTAVRRAICGLQRTADFRVARWLQSTRTPCQCTAPAGGLSPSVRDYGTTCQLRPPLCAVGFRVANAERTTALAVSWEEAQQVSLPRARDVPR